MAAAHPRAFQPRRLTGSMPKRSQTPLAAAFSKSVFARSDMRYGPLALMLVGASVLGGCDGGVLDPKGPIAQAERQILFNATGIMLAIVIPVVIATLGVAFWFRASNERARYRPDFVYSGRLEMLVWSI